jgi:hypothetical protein
MKTCTKCGETKALTEFYKRKDRPSGVNSHCKVCQKKMMTARYNKDPEYVADLQAARRYGITLKDVQDMREAAQGVCQCCGRTDTNKYKRLVIDHCHRTGKVRGLICQRCNSILGYCDDNILTLQNLVEYISSNAD